MGSVTLYVIIIVSLVQFQVILCKPFLFDLICDLVCDDEDNVTTSNSNDIFGVYDYCSCGTDAPPTTTTTKGVIPPSVDLNLPGVSLQMTNTNGQWSLNVNTNPANPANSVIPLPAGPVGPIAPAGPVSPVGPGGPGGPQMPGIPGTSPLPGSPPTLIVPGVTAAPAGPTTAAAPPAAASTAAPP